MISAEDKLLDDLKAVQTVLFACRNELRSAAEFLDFIVVRDEEYLSEERKEELVSLSESLIKTAKLNSEPFVEKQV